MFVLGCGCVHRLQCISYASRGQGILPHDFFFLSGWNVCVSLVLEMAQSHQIILERKVRPYINRDLRVLKVCVTLL